MNIYFESPYGMATCKNADEWLKALGQFFYDYRKEHRFTQTEFSDEIGVTQSLLSKLESGRYNPNLRFIGEMAACLDMDVYLKLG